MHAKYKTPSLKFLSLVHSAGRSQLPTTACPLTTTACPPIRLPVTATAVPPTNQQAAGHHNPLSPADSQSYQLRLPQYCPPTQQASPHPLHKSTAASIPDSSEDTDPAQLWLSGQQFLPRSWRGRTDCTCSSPRWWLRALATALQRHACACWQHQSTDWSMNDMNRVSECVNIKERRVRGREWRQ